MFEDKKFSKTPISDIGEFEFIKKITKPFKVTQKETYIGIGDDSAVLEFKNTQMLISTDLLVEGVHFDLGYVPLKHLGYKSVMVNLSDIYAMNGTASQITVSIAVSNRFNLESIQELYKGIEMACKNYQIDLIGGDTSSSLSGLIISIAAIGYAKKNKITLRKGAKPNDLLVVTGDLGGAYIGLQVLEREKAVYKVNPQSQPDLSDYSYCIGKQLKPEARKDIPLLLEELNILPTSMIDISDGLSSEIIHLSKSSKLGCQLFEDKIPIDPEVIKTCQEFKMNSSLAALNGGEDYELLFTINQKDYDKIKNHPYLSVIGHMTEKNEKCYMITGLGQKIELEAQGWNSLKKSN
tara:strand:- start:82 stop:1134 length:1053 start_codon:yes stop_codon:yes gene_type:complete